MILRPYQSEAIASTFKAWETASSVLGVASTGLGKTIVFASIIAQYPGRVMVVAHREELIFQAANKINQVTGLEPDIEMAELMSCESLSMGKSRVVVSTIQTQTAGTTGGRMQRFNPHEFDLLVIDEAHHGTADTYRRVIDYYRQNPNLKVLGVTATPDRADEEALGQIFEQVAFEFDLRYGIEQGWLVPVEQAMVHVSGLDLSRVRTTAGDLNGADLAAALEFENGLHKIASPTIDLTSNGQPTLIFADTVDHAERLSEILNRHRADCARWVCGKTPKPERRKLFADFAEQRYQYLVNVGVLTEGFDEPSVAVVVMANPTKSRAKYAQMIGRGTRALPGVVDGPAMATDRKSAIARSGKPGVLVIDFAGNAGRHRLITSADILGGKCSDEVIDRARELTAKEPRKNTMQALEQAEEELIAERAQARQQEAARRAQLIAQAEFSTTEVDPFDAFGIIPERVSGWDRHKPIPPKMLAMLERQGVPVDGITFKHACQLTKEITTRWKDGRCSLKQAQILAQRGLSTDVSRADAKAIIDGIAAKEGWGQRKPRPAVNVPPPPTMTRY